MTDSPNNSAILDPQKAYSFKLDDFQLEAIKSIAEGHSVIVCAPTGSGKTVVAEYAIRRALVHGQRCFYTTPLKALSNQKFGDLRRMYGDDKVGLLTGDTTVNRNASIVVMTTEVYRNMLYGTVLGDVKTNLVHVEAVIVDECHYMNDPDRGTVWEELVIYSPAEIQLVALSATVANADELCEWFRSVHGETDLVQSSYRPVPLRHHYYYDGEIYPLLNKSGRLNPRLCKAVRVEPQAPAAEQGREGGRRPLVKLDYPEKVVAALDKADMLPAIYFLFSRKKCDEAARHSDGAVSMSNETRRELNAEIDNAIMEHPALAENPQLAHLRNGIAAHHAGLLPLWKVLVENLFQKGLIQVVYATETLAAGINMPARTTVISAISKYSDEGLRKMTASEFLQMSGRAGRRGMDEIGHVVVVHHPFEPVESAGTLAKAPADPLVSRFTPAYGMVLNLLQRHTPEESRELIERSFGQFVAEHSKGAYAEQAGALDAEIAALSTPLCEGEAADLSAFRKLRDKWRNMSLQTKNVRRGLRGGEGELSEADKAALDASRVKLEAARELYETYPCFSCERAKECAKSVRDLHRLHTRKAQLDYKMELARTSYWTQFQNLEKVLEVAGYIMDHKPTWEGELAASLRATNVFFLAEVALSGVLEKLHPAEVAGIMSSLVVGDSRAALDIGMRPSRAAERAIDDICGMAADVELLQKKYDVNTSVLLNSVFSGLTEFWCRGADWEHVKKYLGTEEGDLIRAMRRTLDLLRQFSHAPHMPEEAARLCREAEELLDRDDVHEAVIWVD